MDYLYTSEDRKKQIIDLCNMIEKQIENMTKWNVFNEQKGSYIELIKKLKRLNVNNQNELNEISREVKPVITSIPHNEPEYGEYHEGKIFFPEWYDEIEEVDKRIIKKANLLREIGYRR